LLVVRELENLSPARLFMSIFDLLFFSLALFKRFVIGHLFHELGYVLAERVSYH
jgi:hypothetical protein